MAKLNSRLLLAFAVLSLVSAACNSQPSTPDGSAATTDGGAASTATRMIGPAGGAVTLGGATLVVPPGAVDAATPIRMSVTTSPIPAGYVGRSPLYRFEPSGLVFAHPVTLTLPFEGDAVGVAIYWSRPGGGYEQLASAVAGHTVSALVAHFSDGFAGPSTPTGGCTWCNGTCADDGSQACRDATGCRGGQCNVVCHDGCDTDAVCSAGACVLSCVGGTTACGGSCADLQADLNNCGACGRACPPGQVCAAGACVMICGPGLTACSGVCRDLTTDRANCGGCGHGCATGESCSSGACVRSCGGGTTDCGSACRDLQVDANNCGACGLACPPGQGCSSGVCTTTCTAGLSLCTGVCSNLASDLSNCGACGHRCASGQVCSGGACSTICPSGQTPCGGLCVSTSTNPDHCGGCDVACPLRAGADRACTSAACNYVCTVGRGDCDLSATNGCEVAFATDVGNCGRCGVACVAPSNGTVGCTGSACVPSCDPGYVLAGTVCNAIAAPRPLAPLATATVTSRHPTLRWALVAGIDGAHVDICRDRACVTVEQRYDVSAAFVRPTVDLAPGVHFWRLYGRSGGIIGPVAGPVWEFFVGPRNAPVDTSWGTVADFNGDGYADLVVTAFGASSRTGRVYVYLGSATGLVPTPATILSGPDGPGGEFGSCAASAGDLNGDGYADLVVAADNAAGGLGRAYVYLGSAAGLATVAAVTVTGPPVGDGFFGQSVASAGDLNGDGYADLVVGATLGTGPGRAYVFYGNPAGIPAAPSVTLAEPAGVLGDFGQSVASAGDLNGDGYADLVVAADGQLSGTSRAYVYHGGPAGLSATPTATVTGVAGPSGSRNPTWVAGAGDLNGDGYADLVVGASDVGATRAGQVYVCLGGSTGVAAIPTVTLTGPDGAGGEFGQRVASAGDLDNDGYADLVVGAPGAVTGTGRAYIYRGSSTGLAAPATTTLTGPDGTSGDFGRSVASAGDLNGDGYADLVVGAEYVMSGAGRAYVYTGSFTGLATTPTTTLMGPDGASGNFGWSVASAAEVRSPAGSRLGPARRCPRAASETPARVAKARRMQGQ